MSKFLINRLYTKKSLFELKMDEGMSFRDHINKFNKWLKLLRKIKLLFYWHPYKNRMR